jgi:hypothetical protein
MELTADDLTGAVNGRRAESDVQLPFVHEGLVR